MSDASVPDPTKQDQDAALVGEQTVNQMFDELLNGLGDEADKMSAVLFPTTFGEVVSLGGQTLKLTPLPIKRTKELFTALKPLSESIQASVSDPEVVKTMDLDMVGALETAARTIFEHHNATELLRRLSDQDFAVSELQALALQQQAINGANDFLLAPLRTIVRIMQISEILQHRFQSILTTQSLQTDITAPSTT